MSKISDLNDRLRTTFTGGTITLTEGFMDLSESTQEDVINKIQNFNKWTKDNDPYGEHDFGSVQVGDEKVFWKIDYYNKAMDGGSPDASDEAVTQRVMTIMLNSEY